MKKYDLLLLAIYGILLTLLIVGAHLHIKERQQVRDRMNDWRYKSVNVVVIEDTKNNLNIEIARDKHSSLDFKMIGTSLLLDNMAAVHIKNDTLFIGKRAVGNLYTLVVDRHVEVDLLDAVNIPVLENTD